MAASRRAPWMRMTQGSPECLSTRRALVSVGRDRVSPALVAGARGRVLPPRSTDQNVYSSLYLLPPPKPRPRPTSSQPPRHRLSGARGLWRNHWP